MIVAASFIMWKRQKRLRTGNEYNKFLENCYFYDKIEVSSN